MFTWYQRISGTGLLVLEVALATRTSMWFPYACVGLTALLLATTWLVPATIVDVAGFRTIHRGGRTYAWSKVAEVPDFGPGLAPLRVQVLLVTGKRVTLHSVRGMEVPWLRQLLAQSRAASGPPPVTSTGTPNG